MSLGNFDTAIIECANNSNDIFPFSERGDVVFYPSNSNQRLCLTTEIQETPAVCLHHANVGFGTIDPQNPLHIKDKKSFWENSELRLHSSCINVENNKGDVDLGRVAASHKFPMTGFYTLADSQDLAKQDEVKPGNAFRVIDNIPVHYLSKKNDKNAARMMGCLAHEVKDTYEPCVYVNEALRPGDVPTKMIDYSKLVPALVQCVKDLKSRVVYLESQVNPK